jgi:hypothetical protein
MVALALLLLAPRPETRAERRARADRRARAERLAASEPARTECRVPQQRVTEPAEEVRAA